MTNRERWIIYPLLFYALAMGFKANYVGPDQLRCETIACRQLTATERVETHALQVRVVNGMTALLDLLRAMQTEARAESPPPASPPSASPPPASPPPAQPSPSTQTTAPASATPGGPAEPTSGATPAAATAESAAADGGTTAP